MVTSGHEEDPDATVMRRSTPPPPPPSPSAPFPDTAGPPTFSLPPQSAAVDAPPPSDHTVKRSASAYHPAPVINALPPVVDGIIAPMPEASPQPAAEKDAVFVDSASRRRRRSTPIALIATMAVVGVGLALFLSSREGGSPPPDPPTTVMAEPGPLGSGTVSVSWTPPPTADGATVEFEAVSTVSGASCTSTTSPCTVEALPLGTAHSFTVRALSGSRRSEPSDESPPVFVAGPHGFDDVQPEAFYGIAVSWLRERGITSGYGGDPRSFNPEGTIARGEMALFLHRVMGTPTPGSPHGFTDVSPSGELADAVAWLREQEITSGFGGDSSVYNPSGPVNRAQVATAMYRMAGRPEGAGPHGFADVDPSAYYEIPVRWIRSSGITTGFGGDTSQFNPDGPVTRSQMAAFLFRLAATPEAWDEGVSRPSL